MKIIDKNQDCYDYLSNIYGIDNKIVYDRRGSFIVDQKFLIGWINDHRSYKHDYYFILEVGFYQYLFVFKNLIEKATYGINYHTDVTYDNFELVHIFSDNKHYFVKPLTIQSVYVNTNYSWKKREHKITITSFKESINIQKNSIENPIIKDTEITRFISVDTIWKNLYNYISSLDNDKDVDIINSDVDKAVNHGFDARWSFRHPIK